MKTLLNFLLIVFWSSFAAAEANWKSTAIAVAPDSELQEQIEEVTKEFFASSLHKTLCQVFLNPSSASHSLGISLEVASEIYRQCPEISSNSVAKVLPKKYYLSFNTSLGLDSWTDYDNHTYIFVDESFNKERLRAILLHELAITADAKTNFLFSGYLQYRAKEHSTIQNGIQIITMDDFSEHEKTLQQAFNLATWQPLRLTFTTLRAFNLEKISAGQRPLNETHSTCSTEFRELLQAIKKLPLQPKSDGLGQIPEMLADATSKHYAPQTSEQEEALLGFLLSENLRLYDAQDNLLTFCQFMTTPLLTGRHLHSFFAAGPRPRLTGGSGGQGQWRQSDFKTPSFAIPKVAPLQLDKVQEAVKKLQQKNAPPARL